MTPEFSVRCKMHTYCATHAHKTRKCSHLFFTVAAHKIINFYCSRFYSGIFMVDSKRFYFYYSIHLRTGFCVKAHKQSNDEKCFLNVCQSDSIPPPEDISVEQLTEILASETPSTYKIPMSITELRLTPDKAGKDAVVCDVAIHPAFFRKIEAVNVFRDFLITIVFEALDTKYNMQINRESWIILKNRKCMGKLVKHRIQNRDVKTVYESYQNPTPEHKNLIQELDGGKSATAPTNSIKKPKLISEVTSKTAAEPKPTDSNSRLILPTKTNVSSASSEMREPQYRLFKSRTTLIAEFLLPEVAWQNEIALDLGRDRLVLEARRTGYLFDSFFPHNINHHQSSANFDNESHVSISAYTNDVQNEKQVLNSPKSHLIH